MLLLKSQTSITNGVTLHSTFDHNNMTNAST